MASFPTLFPGRIALIALLAATLLCAAAPAGAASVIRILAFGDSLVHGYGLPREAAFPAQLEQALRAEGYEVEVVNGGNSGETTAGGLARLDWVLNQSPDIAVVVLGANDGLRGLEPAETKANLAAIIEGFRAAGARVLLAGMLAPPNLGADYVSEFDALYPALAEEQEVDFYRFFLEGVAAEPSLNQPDGIHPNAEGVRRIVASLLPSLKPLLEADSRE